MMPIECNLLSIDVRNPFQYDMRLKSSVMSYERENLGTRKCHFQHDEIYISPCVNLGFSLSSNVFDILWMKYILYLHDSSHLAASSMG